jgi:hypothetical protein
MHAPGRTPWRYSVAVITRDSDRKPPSKIQNILVTQVRFSVVPLNAVYKVKLFSLSSVGQKVFLLFLLYIFIGEFNITSIPPTVRGVPAQIT